MSTRSKQSESRRAIWKRTRRIRSKTPAAQITRTDPVDFEDEDHICEGED